MPRPTGTFAARMPPEQLRGPAKTTCFSPETTAFVSSSFDLFSHPDPVSAHARAAAAVKRAKRLAGDVLGGMLAQGVSCAPGGRSGWTPQLIEGCMGHGLAPIEKAHLSDPTCVRSPIVQCHMH